MEKVDPANRTPSSPNIEIYTIGPANHRNKNTKTKHTKRDNTMNPRTSFHSALICSIASVVIFKGKNRLNYNRNSQR